MGSRLPRVVNDSLLSIGPALSYLLLTSLSFRVFPLIPCYYLVPLYHVYFLEPLYLRAFRSILHYYLVPLCHRHCPETADYRVYRIYPITAPLDI